jgi:threonine dehydrogenase-like Zn-dependent dehydrogenase
MKALILEADWEARKGYKPTEFEVRTKTALTSSSVWRHPKLSLKDVSKPKIVNSKDVIVKILASGICGTDVHLYETDKEGYVLYPGLVKLPCIIGHEFAGIVEEIGSGVKDLKEGDLVAVEQMAWCGECTPCRNGFPDYCEYIEEYGVTLPGGHAEYVKVERKYCWSINSLLRVYSDKESACELGALAEPVAVAYNAMFVKAGGFLPGSSVVVHGAGPIGLSAIALARIAGASKIIVIEAIEIRKKLAKTLGADHVLDPTEIKRLEDAIRELTDNKGADMHVECAGAMEKTSHVMTGSLAINGQIVLIGRAAKEVPMYLEQFQIGLNSLCGVRGHARGGTYPNVIKLMASGRINVERMVTKRYSLDRAVEAIKESSKRRDGKIMIRI